MVFNNKKSSYVRVGPLLAELSTGRVDPRIESGRAGSSKSKKYSYGSGRARCWSNGFCAFT